MAAECNLDSNTFNPAAMLTPLNESEAEKEILCQDQRAFLRERFLRVLVGLKGQAGHISMYEKSVHCLLGMSDIEFQHLTVSNLQTPIGTLPHALLRTTDIVSIKTTID